MTQNNNHFNHDLKTKFVGRDLQVEILAITSELAHSKKGLAY